MNGRHLRFFDFGIAGGFGDLEDAVVVDVHHSRVCDALSSCRIRVDFSGVSRTQPPAKKTDEKNNISLLFSEFS